ncbi:MAG: hypothetical protein LBH32_04005 [Dysgonamonadaceae bacterium]|jgi:hypothetical protein|nr:hypothetical protein [Dysgonamonadaceae bacterium]
MNKDFEKPEEIFLQTIRTQKKEEIAPPETLKARLDKALSAKRRRKGFFTLQIPVYQAAAVAAIFFILGFAANFLRPAPQPEIVYKTKETVKYVDRPVPQIEYVKVYVPQKTKKQADYLAYQIADDDTLGVSLDKDTILQKMMVTIY